MLFFSLVGRAAEHGELPRIQLLLSASGEPYTEVAQALEARLQALTPGRADIDIRSVQDQSAADGDLFVDRPVLIVPIGIRATALALQNAGTIPVLSLLIPERDYRVLLGSQLPVEKNSSSLRSAIYLDQPLERQLDLLQLILPDRKRLSALTGPHSAGRNDQLAALAKQRGLTLFTESVERDANPVTSLARLMDDADVLLALPDPEVFNRTNLQAILFTTYRNYVPVIGFSRAYVRAGALAAVYSDARQIGEQAGDWLAELVRTDRWTLGEPRYPAYYSVAINTQVAQSLGIAIADEAHLTEQLRTKGSQEQ